MDNKILITGASGFLGGFLLEELKKHPSPITIMGRTKIENFDFIFNDLKSNLDLEENSYRQVIHIAGKAHSIPRTETEINEFYQVNTKGTQNILKALNNQKKTLESFIFASTIAVYGVDEGIEISENNPLNPVSPYAKSKLKAEEAIKKWCVENNVRYYILRLPLIVGENPPGNLHSMINAIKKGWYVKVKNNTAKKSMVLAEDIACLIPSLDQYNSGIYNLTDGYHPSFTELENLFEKNLNKKIRIVIPKFFLNMVALGGDLLAKLGIPFPLNSKKIQKITSTLTVSDKKARESLNWSPQLVINKIKNFNL